MRKEVKLGMAIGGGVVGLLVVYLLVAPPSHGKKGTQLVSAGGNGNGDLVDPGINPEVPPQVNPDPPPAAGHERSSAPANNTAANDAATNNTARNSPPAGPGSSDAANRTGRGGEASSGGRGSDQPTPPAQGSVRDQMSGSLGNGQRPGSQSDGASGASDDRDETRSPAHSERVPAGGDVASVIADSARTPAYFDPNAAWGGGVSTDAPALHPQSLPAKGGLIASGGNPHSHKAGSPAPGASAPGRNGMTTHIVRAGETFSSIAQAVYGNAAYYPHILRANPGLKASALQINMVINLPAVEDVRAGGTGDADRSDGPAGAKLVEAVKIDARRQYQVVAGDSLYKIGQKLYGKGTMGDRIYEVNRQTIGADPRKLKLGMILQLPEPPTSGAGAAAAGGGAAIGARSAEGSLEDAWNNVPQTSEPDFGNPSEPK